MIYVTSTDNRVAPIRFREILAANRTIYVRTDGSDTNDGSLNDSAHAFLTVDAAVLYAIGNIDVNNYTLTIKVADGTYSGCTLRSYYPSGTGKIIIEGNTTTPTNVIFNTQSGNFSDPGCTWTLTGMRFTNTSGVCFLCQFNTNTILSLVNFHTSGVSQTQIQVSRRAMLRVNGDYTITAGGGTRHIDIFAGGLVEMSSGITITLSGTPTYSVAFVQCSEASILRVTGITITGAATGSRYVCTLNGTIITGGGGANFFPGNAAASAPATGGIYN